MRAAAFLLSGLILGLGVTGAASAPQGVPAENRVFPWTGAMPACESGEVLGRIQARFDTREDRFWNSGLRIVGYEHVRPVAYRPWGSEMIPRRYCTGKALVFDGVEIRKRRIDYVIGEDLGIIGATWGVQWCVAGLDRHWANAPYCRMARP